MNGQNAGVQRYAVAFASFAPLDTDIFIADRDGGNAKPFLRHPDLDYDASFSADGRWVVFTSTRNGSADMGIEDIQKIRSALRERGSTQIVSVDLATSDRTVLTEGRGEKWSPHWIAGRRLAYVSRDPDGGVELVGGPGGARGEMRNPSWSPDRGHMVFHREVGSGWPPVRRLWSRDASFELLRTAVFPSSSPTGDRLVVNDERAGILHNSILLMSGDGSARSILFGDPDRSALAPAWSPQGDKIAAGIGRFRGHCRDGSRWKELAGSDRRVGELRPSKLVA